MHKLDLDEKDILDLYNNIREQSQDDRELLKDLIDDLRSKVLTKEDYAINGQNLAKLTELMIKQTGQYIDLVKILREKVKTKDDGGVNLSPEDYKNISDAIEGKIKDDG